MRRLTETEKLELSITDTKRDIETFKGAGATSASAQEDAERARAQARAHERARRRLDRRHQTSMRVVPLKTGILSIFSRLGCASTSVEEMLGRQGVTETT